MLRTMFACLLAATTLSAQAIIQQSVAATAGTVAGTVMGKKVSDALDATLRSTQAAAKTHDVRPPKPLPPAPAVRPAGRGTPNAEPAPEPGEAARWYPPAPPNLSRKRAAPVQVAFVAPPPPPPPVVPDVPQPVDVSAAQLQEVAEGTARKELLDKLGVPVSKITIPDGGQLREIYYYQQKGETVGAVRLVDGAVQTVTLSR